MPFQPGQVPIGGPGTAIRGPLTIRTVKNVGGLGWQGVTLADSAGNVRGTATNAITAFAGGGQANAVLLTAVINRVTIVGTAADSVKLPLAVAGMMITVTNAAAANSLNIFPNTGDAINALGANAAFAMVVTKTVTFFCAVAGQWHTLLTA